MREEIADLAARGCTYLQMDEVPLAVLCDPKNQRNRHGRAARIPNELIDNYIDAINASIKDRPAGMTVCVHLCRGNRGHGMADGGYEPVADACSTALDVDGFFLEYDTPRAGDFAPLRFVPKGKKVVLGLVTTKLARDRNRRRPEAPHRRGGEVRAARPAVPLAAMRLRLDRRRQYAGRGRAMGEINMIVEIARRSMGISR